ncbi:MAG: hypothetical protein JWO08_3644 [Verrucomicrobiaceae bacterium]|nr:hypothetical protein [Verrucomicrobiaceae bacterium]
MRYFASHTSGDTEKRAWAAALRKPVEAALEDLRHNPRRAATLLAPVIEDAVKMARHRRQERRVENIGKWCLCLTRPHLWKWALKALWEGDPVWPHIQEQAQWHQVPELLMLDNRTGHVLGHAETVSHCIAPGEMGLEEMCGTHRAVQPGEEISTRVPDEEGLQGELASRVLVVVGWRCKLAARVRGHAPANLRNSLQVLCEEAEALLGSPAPHGSTHGDMIDGLLAGSLVNKVASSRPRGWVLAVGGVVFGCLLLWAGVKEYRWRYLVMALDSEPGLKVLNHDNSWGRREISGLRDPLARPPEEVARALGLSPGEIVMHFKAFVSADEPLAARRAGARPSASPESVIHRKQSPAVSPP